MTLSLVMRPCARSRCGQIANSSGQTGPKSIWQASDDTGGKAAVRLDQRGDAKPGARPQDHLRALGRRT